MFSMFGQLSIEFDVFSMLGRFPVDFDVFCVLDVWPISVDFELLEFFGFLPIPILANFLAGVAVILMIACCVDFVRCYFEFFVRPSW